ncbi:MAG TPA: ferredoxin family protein, partial [Planctomycetaceae bacterium]|nr:ferredoxin family protein [Planctomycetaceae bacterium]
VVISQHQGKNPAKRHLEEELAAALIMDPEVDVSIVPHLYDLDAGHTGTLFLRSVPGDVAVLAWLYPRAARWTLDRQGVKGREGVSLLKSEGEDDDFEDDDEAAEREESQGIGAVNVLDRRIYCIDLRGSADPRVYLDEVRRIARESSVQTVNLLSWIQGSPQPAQLQRYLQPERMLAASQGGNGDGETAGVNSEGNGQASDLPEPTRRRWYPVIDYSRCTNCMECIDFCLFGVYGVDQLDRILVEEQDNCKKGCPACSRVCPENAIIFPGHKTPAIAGADGEVAGLKIDLSKLFGAPDKSALELAVAERDTELVNDGREAVGMAVGIPKRHAGRAPEKRDELDDLMDGLDGLDL